MTPALDTPTAERALTIKTSRAFLPLLTPGKRYRGAYGGRGSGKSMFFAGLLVDRFVEDPGIRAVCVREFQNSLEMSAKQLVEDTIKSYGVDDVFRVLNTHIETPQGGRILFQGMSKQTSDSIKSLEGFDIAWIEEAQRLSQRSLDILRPTIRKDGSEIWASWNPAHPDDPIDQLLRGSHPPEDAVVVEVNYQDNPWFPKAARAEMVYDRGRDLDKYEHIWKGGYENVSEARVFRNVTVQEFETPVDAAFLFGADWGFSVDPTVLVRGFERQINEQRRQLFIDAEAYQIGCEIDRTPALFDTVGDRMAREWEILADSARPETIAYMQAHGYRKMKAARKGPNSVQEGVEFLRSFDIVIHPRCTHVVDEFTSYLYKRDSLTGRILPRLVDAKNHTIDACRYMVEPLNKKRRGLGGLSFGGW